MVQLASKIKPRPVIDEGFRSTYMVIMQEIVDEIKERASRNGGAAFFKRYPDEARVIKFAASVIERNRVPDEVLVKLYGSEFEKFSGFERRDKSGTRIRWLVGTTREIFMTTGDTTSANKYYTGQWHIYIPDLAFVNRTMSRVHLIPALSPKETRHRHPHHYATANESPHPLDWTPHTCTGGFGQVFQSVVSTGDVPEAFRLLYTYIGRVNLRSILTSQPAYIEWITKADAEWRKKNANTSK